MSELDTAAPNTNGKSKHGAAYSDAGQFSPDAVAASMSRGDGGFGRAQRSYYDHPVLRKAHWRWEITWYFFVGGMMSGSAVLSTILDEFGDRDGDDKEMIRNGRYIALAGSAISGVLLIKDLGRPERFLNMMRIFKFKSPMSVGVYALSLFSGMAGLAVADQLHRDGILPINFGGFLPRIVRNGVFAFASSLMVSYTGVLVSATAIPVWNQGRRFIPALFVCGGATATCALNAALLALGGGSPEAIEKLEKFETIAALAEAALLLAYERSSGEVGKALFGGETGKHIKERTLIGGIAIPTLLKLPMLLRKKSSHKTNVAFTLGLAGLALFGGYTLRATIMEAGRKSADDPRAYLRQVE
jgi:formate-dependent nitrite reductase membrane component NrfD